MQTFTTSTASATGNLTGAAATQIILSPGFDGPSSLTSIPPQILGVHCTMSASSATATLGFYLVVPGATTGYERIARFSASVEATTFRTPLSGGASGNYIAKTTFDVTKDNKLDLLGVSEYVANSTGPCQWWVAVETLSAGSITIYFVPTRAI